MPLEGHSTQSCQSLQQGRWTRKEGGGQQYQQHDREQTHEKLNALAQLCAHYFGQRCATFAQRNHAAEVVVYTASEDGTQHNP